MNTFKVAEIRVGKAVPYGPAGKFSAIDKQLVRGSIHAGPLGLDGDEQGDRTLHGGPNKALHAYARSHLPRWAAELPHRADHFQAGAFGENLVIDDVTEADFCLGDRWRLGEALLEVSQGRQPCWKLNLRFDLPDMARRVQDTGRSGWYFRVLEAGAITAGDQGMLIERPHSDWSIARVSHLLYHDRMNRPALVELAALPGLTDSWKRLAAARLASGQTEDWSRRIETPTE
ncbi:MOSC domain-containing protein [Mesorhizobium sp. 1M-11]|uniref:MOSC domain-containing protein n=1 Tax=Mesorhizobium sp. 1M-11 TaxID=1529006 RepID=UPI0006C73A24|nr:MOSC domain-containing protein [Mesorhizobium sp. 1M-11]